GGIPEVVAHEETGLLVHYDAADPDGYRRRLADALNALLTAPDRAAAMGRAGRERAVAEFGWDAVAARTTELYRAVCRTSRASSDA
ncbi:MAG: glycosyltransferase, partial [Micromonosporaceae bacterium]